MLYKKTFAQRSSHSKVNLIMLWSVFLNVELDIHVSCKQNSVCVNHKSVINAEVSKVGFELNQETDS